MRVRSAFTLIEILIVIAIIGILAVVAVSSYGAVRQKVKIDLMADTLISTIKEQQDAAKTGRGTPVCYGIYFNSAASASQIQLITAPYVAVESVGEMADYCDMSKSDLSDFALFENFKILDMTAFGAPRSSYLIMFKPPEAAIVIGSDPGGALAPLSAPGSIFTDSLIKITIGSADGSDQKTIGFDVATGVAERIIDTGTNSPQL